MKAYIVTDDDGDPVIVVLAENKRRAWSLVLKEEKKMYEGSPDTPTMAWVKDYYGLTEVYILEDKKND